MEQISSTNKTTVKIAIVSGILLVGVALGIFFMFEVNMLVLALIIGGLIIIGVAVIFLVARSKKREEEQLMMREQIGAAVIENIKQAKRQTCHFCGFPIENHEKFCSSCGESILRCSVCKLPISFGEEVGICSLCETKGHLTHLQEWVKTKGKCPHCLQNLPVEGIVAIEVEKAGK